MGYAYEDEDIENIGAEEEVPKLKQDGDGTNKQIVDNLLASDGEVSTSTYSSYSAANLLDSEEESGVYLDDLLNKNDQKFLDAYIGNNVGKITNKKFNFAAFCFGGSYLIYRKIYFVGAAWMIICLLVQLLFPIAEIKWYITALFQVFAAVGCGFVANQLILNNAASKLLNLKMKNEKELKDKMASIGGTNIVLFLLALLINSGVLFVSYYVTGVEMLKKLEYNTNYLQYDGRINANENIIISDYIDIEVPDGYRDAYLDPYRYSYLYNEDLNIAIDLMQVDLYESSKSLIEDVAIYENMTEDDVKMMTINNTRWYYVSSNLAYYAAGIINGKMYFFKHTHNGNKEALINYENFIGSIKAK